MPSPLRRASIALGVAALGALPSFVWDETAWRARYSLEYGFLVLAVAAGAGTRFATLTRRAAVALYALLLLFLTYEWAFKGSFHRAPALVEDVRLLVNLGHFLSEMRSAAWIALVAGSAIGAALLVAAATRLFAAFQGLAGAARPRTLAAGLAAWTVLGATSAWARGPVRAAGDKVADNYRASLAVRAHLRALREGTRDDRYRDLMKVKLSRRPSFYFLVIEAYGEVLATWDMTPAYRALLSRVEERLANAGFRARTAYSVAPVHGGRSWLSLATLQSGILIDQPESFKAFERVSLEVPTLVGFLRQQGYRTASLEPGTKQRTGVGSADLYGHDLRVDAPRLDYRGKAFGFGGIPDRYSLETFRTAHLPNLPEPRYVFFMGVSTHYPWSADTVPVYDGGQDWPPLPGLDAIGSDFRRYYVKSVEYDFRALTDFLTAETSRDIVVFVLGDHQPRLESNAPGEVSFHTPIHVLSRDPAFVEAFADAGFTAGLFAEPGRTRPLAHEGLFSLIVTKLAEVYGSPVTQAFAKPFPNGIGLAGLTR